MDLAASEWATYASLAINWSTVAAADLLLMESSNGALKLW